MWEMLVVRSKIPSDEETLYRWLKESCEAQGKSTSIWNLDELGEFFNDKLASGENDFSTLSLDGFSCIQSYFLMINEKENKVQRLAPTKSSSGSSSYTDRMMTGFSSITGPVYGDFSFMKQNRKTSGDKAEEEGTFKIYVFPSQLNGIETMWNIALNCSNKQVESKAIQLVTRLYQNLAIDFEKE